MKSLNGKELAGFIQQRQVKQVRSMRQSNGLEPKLVIFKTTEDPVIETYVRVKKRYGEEIGVEVDVRQHLQSDLIAEIEKANSDNSVTGMIVQLPLLDTSKTDLVLEAVDPLKDVDGLCSTSTFIPATPQAIEWLLDGYNTVLEGKVISIVGMGRLVGKPLKKLLEARGLNIQAFDDTVKDLRAELLVSDVVISATGVAGLIDESMLKHGATVVDAGVATADGKTVGDVADSAYLRDDLAITPKKGGVGPLTVSALFENVIKAGLSQLD